MPLPYHSKLRVSFGDTGLGLRDLILLGLYLVFFINSQPSYCRLASLKNGSSIQLNSSSSAETRLNAKQNLNENIDSDVLGIEPGVVDDYTNWASIISMVRTRSACKNLDCQRPCVIVGKPTAKDRH